MKTKPNTNQVTLRDVIAAQLAANNTVSTYRLDDGSGSGITVKKRNGNTEYMIELEFDDSGHGMTGVGVYAGDVIESVEHQRVI